MPPRWFVHDHDAGGVTVRIPRIHRWLLRGALGEFRNRLVDGGDDLDRLHPPAYLGHPGLEGEYQKYMREELASSRLNAIDGLIATLDATRLDAAQAQSWLQAINTVRVIVGTALGIDHDGWSASELDITDDDDPRLAYLTLYGVLQSLLYALLQGITPDGVTDPDPELLGYDADGNPLDGWDEDDPARDGEAHEDGDPGADRAGGGAGAGWGADVDVDGDADADADVDWDDVGAGDWADAPWNVVPDGDGDGDGDEPS